MNASWDTFKLASIVGGVLMVIAIDAALVMLVPKRRQRRCFLLLAAAYNFLLGGALLLVLISILLGICTPPPSLSSSGHELTFQLLLISSFFVGWTALIFSCGYLQSARGKAPVQTFLRYGGALKYGAFAIGATFFFLLPDDVYFIGFPLPVVAFVGGALPNLLFALLFSRLYRTSKVDIPLA
jgi:hypothetical protein